MALKAAPERWQANMCAPRPSARGSAAPSHALPSSLSRMRSGEEFDVVVAFEERVFEQIIDGARRALRVAPSLA